MSSGLSDVAEAAAASVPLRLLPDEVAAVLDFEQPVNNRPPAKAQSGSMTINWTVGRKYPMRIELTQSTKTEVP
ncbi:MAG: hypothetical protein ACLPRE_00140, partial [Limisphaerales bacterium]